MQVIKGVQVKRGEVSCGVGRPAPSCSHATIQPEEVKLGNWWWHSCVPELPEETSMEEFMNMMQAKGLMVIRQDMAADPKVDWDTDLCLDDWTPSDPFKPEVGAFILVLGDGEDGPFAIWGINENGHRYCERCRDIYTPLDRKFHPEVCWDCVTAVALEEGQAS